MAVMDFENGGVLVAAPAVAEGLGEYVGREDPTRASEISKRILAAADEENEEPLITAPSPGDVYLAAGLVLDGKVYHDAEVLELNGADEEAMAKATTSARLIDTILKRAVKTIGPLEQGNALDRELDKLLLGDRLSLLSGVRRVTFGDVMRLDVKCPNCGDEFQVDYSLTEDVPVKSLDQDDPAQREFELVLPSERVAMVHLVDGAAQKAVYTLDNMQKSDAERNTLLLQHVVVSLDGKPVRTLGQVREGLASGDRREILKYLVEHQPGPQFGDVKQDCPECEAKFPLVVDILDSFRS